MASQLLGQGERRPGRHRRSSRSRVRGERRVARRMGGGHESRRAERTDHARGDRQDDGGPAGGGASGPGWPTVALGGDRVARGGGCPGIAGSRRWRRSAAPGRAVSAQPGRLPGDPAGARGGRRWLQVRDDRDGGRGRHRSRRRAGWTASSARDPSPRRFTTGSRRRLARCRPPGTGRDRPVARLDRDLRHARCRGRLPGLRI